MVNWQPVYLSVQVALVALVLVFVLGTIAARLMTRLVFRGRDAVEAILTLPLVLPPVVTGFILLLLIGKHGPIGRLFGTYFDTQIIFTVNAAILAAVVVSFPLMYQSAKAAFESVDPHLEDVARTLGAGEGRVFFTVTLPMAWPGLLAGLVLSFARALGEFGATIMVAGNIPGKTQTIPLAIYFASEAGDMVTAGIYAVIISCLSFVMIFWLNRWSRAKMGKTIQQRG